ncbi:MAG TPA: dihydroorotase [Myxococcales bacterium]|nr:dihydroorotase [Myxococcales bacterium]
MQRLTITRPDDWHVHLRDGAGLDSVAQYTAAQFGRAVVMPNLKPPVVTTEDAERYRARIRQALGGSSDFEPLMTLYLTDNTSVDEIERAKASGMIFACKLYPAGATTNSDSGVTDLGRIDPVLAAMAQLQIPLLIHGEVTANHVDIFDRERRFLHDVLAPLLARHPRLRVVLEHITTADAADFVLQGPDNLGATITAHHLLINRNAMLAGGIRPHLYCLPILKREKDRKALLEVATSDCPRFFLGTDSAPHPIGAKESSCGCAGCFTAMHAIGLYAEAFDSVGKLDRLEAFASFNGPDFHGLPRNQGTLTLVQTPCAVPEMLEFGDAQVRPFRAGQTIRWSVDSATQ